MSFRSGFSLFSAQDGYGSVHRTSPTLLGEDDFGCVMGHSLCILALC